MASVYNVINIYRVLIMQHQNSNLTVILMYAALSDVTQTSFTVLSVVTRFLKF